MPERRVVVVGAGVGGLAAALVLAARGLDVVLVEAAGAPGGKLRQVQVQGSWQDAGPTVFTMRWVFDELFAAAGAALSDHLTLRPVQTLARHAWGDQSRLDLYADMRRSEDAIAAFSSPAQARSYRQFCLRAQGTYQTLEQAFLRGSRPSPFSLARRVGWSGLPDLARIAPFTSLWRALGRHFPDPRLRQLFGRYATYCGSSPFQAPATLMLVAHVERSGVWLVDGGMVAIARALETLLLGFGAQLRYHSPVAELLVGARGIRGVRLASGETLAADAVVFNGDVSALGSGLLGAPAARAVPPTAPRRRSLSAITWNMVTPARGFALLRHTVFFSGDYGVEFQGLRGAGGLPADPTIYVCAHDRGDTERGPPGAAERLMCLVNAPAGADTHALSAADLERCTRQTFDKLARSGLRLYPDAQNTVRTTPADFHRMFPGTGGALYGAASHGWMASFRRPGARCAVPGLYLAGGSTHPGPGVPMAALSGRLAADGVLADFAQAAARGRG